MITTSPRRGVGMLGLLSLIALLGTLCAAVSISSMRSATGSLRGIQRLQTQSAAEGAAVLLSTGDAPTSGAVQLGEARVNITPETAFADASTTSTDAATSATFSRLSVSLSAGNRIVYTRNFRATAGASGHNITVEALP